jgi:hypothetical protein
MADEPSAPDERLDKQAWVRRFAVAAFKANNKITWEAALKLGERFWDDFGLFPPEAVARAYAEG